MTTALLHFFRRTTRNVQELDSILLQNEDAYVKAYWKSVSFRERIVCTYPIINNIRVLVELHWHFLVT